MELKQNVAGKKGVSVFACTVKCSPANIMINTNILIYHNLLLIPNHFIRLIESKIKSVVNFVAIKSVFLVISVFVVYSVFVAIKSVFLDISVFVEIKRVFLVNYVFVKKSKLCFWSFQLLFLFHNCHFYIFVDILFYRLNQS